MFAQFGDDESIDRIRELPSRLRDGRHCRFNRFLKTPPILAIGCFRTETKGRERKKQHPTMLYLCA
jgi:hypothetical protein